MLSACHYAKSHHAVCHYAEYDYASDIFIIKQVALNKSSLILIIQKQNTHTLQLFTKIIKTETIYKSNQNAKLKGSGKETKWSY
jgi:hypothetical protein